MVTQSTNSPSSRDIEAIFNRIAPVYDSLNQWLSLGQHHVWKLMSVKWSRPTIGNTALDICCGSGDLTQMLAHRVGPTGKVYGLDFSAEQLAVAKKRTSLEAIEWIEGDALELPFPSRTFDCLTMSYGLRNLIDIPKALMEVYRVLKQGAKAAILDFHRPNDALMSLFQDLYLTNLVVPVAEFYGLKEDYAYIRASLERFPNGTEQVKLGYQAGFSDVVHYPIAGGMMGVLVLTK